MALTPIPDEYQASSRGSSRPPSPSESKPKKQSFGKPGNRPGRIVQPHIDGGTTSHESSPEPLAAPGPQLGNSRLAAQGPAGGTVIQVISRAEAIQRASAILGADASHLSSRTIKLVLEQTPDDLEDTEAAPMEITGGSAPAVLQPAGGVVLGGGHQPPATRIADDIYLPQGPSTQPASANDSSLSRAEPRNEDTATEEESEPEVIELRPEDSVSQHVPPASIPLRALPTPSHPPPTTTTPTAPHANKAKRPIDMRTDLNSDAIDEGSGSESDIEIARPTKRQRLIRPLQPPVPIVCFHPTPPLICHHASHPPPPQTHIDAILTRAAQLVEQVGVGRRDANLNQLAQLLGSLQSRLGAATSGSQPKARQSPSQLKPTDLLEDDAEVLEAEAALELGTHIRRHHKPTLANFPGLRRKIASLAMSDFLAVASTRGAYKTFGVLCGWVKEVYERVWGCEVPHVPLQKAPHPLKSIVSVLAPLGQICLEPNLLLDEFCLSL
ncbi:hypothetical protein FRC08_013137 [Ceratobasidium sp. 394]|nr:hypothetical protein FRC08_013137 [Ceratobasidium sp. 394]